MRGCFVTGTDTCVGKTVLAAALAAALVAAEHRVVAHKPVVTGLEDRSAGSEWPPDHELLAQVTGQAPAAVAPLRFGPALAPHLAAELAGVEIDAAALLGAARGAAASAEIVVVEGVGGLLVPLAPAYAVRDLARELGLPVLVAARPSLGTINHTLLTLEAARAAPLDVTAVVLTPWPRRPSAMERSNRDTIARLGAIEVATLPHIARPEPSLLATAAAGLPVERWVGVGR